MRKLYTLKAGCILLDKKLNKIAIIYRKKHDDYEFPKGHLELNENLVECAIRETAEEIKRIAKIIPNISPIVMKYRTKKGERCKCFYYLAIDNGSSDNTSTDSHKLIWKNFDEVENTLSHLTTKIAWKKSKYKIKNIIPKIII